MNAYIIYAVYALMLIAVLLQYYDKEKARSFILNVIIPILETICSLEEYMNGRENKQLLCLPQALSDLSPKKE